MTAIQLLACAGMIVVYFTAEMKPVSLRTACLDFIESQTKRCGKTSGIIGKIRDFAQELKEAQNILQMTGRGNRFSFICAVALALFLRWGSIAILLEFFLAH